MKNQIRVTHIADGEYRVLQGGLVYLRNPNRSVFPAGLNRGEMVSAATLCEMEELGVEVIES